MTISPNLNFGSQTKSKNIVNDALKIFNSTKQELQNCTLINSLLKLFSDLSEPEKISIIWKQISSLSNSHNDESISYPLLIDCCMKSDPINIDYAIQSLQWIKYKHYELSSSEMKMFSKNISKLISLCNNDIDKLKHIHSLINQYDDIFIKTALINAYGVCSNDSNLSLNVFNSINDNKKNNVSIGAIMKVLLNNGEGDKLLNIYDRCNKSLIDDISNTLAIKACIITNNYSKGQKIYDSLQRMQIMNHPTLRNVLIEFYSHFGDITKAERIFNSEYQA